MDFKPENVLWSPSLGYGYNLPFPGRMLKADIIKCQTWQIHSLHIFKSLLMISIGNINTKLNSYSLKMYFLSTSKHDVSHVSWTDYFEIGEKKWKIIVGVGWRVEGEGASEGNLKHLWVHHHPCLPGDLHLGLGRGISNAISDLFNALMCCGFFLYSCLTVTFNYLTSKKIIKALFCNLSPLIIP